MSARVWVTTTSTRWVSVWTPLRASVVAAVAPAWALAPLSAVSASDLEAGHDSPRSFAATTPRLSWLSTSAIHSVLAERLSAPINSA
jgi:hypothetical protein